MSRLIRVGRNRSMPCACKVPVDEAKLQAVYDRLLQYGREHGANSDMIGQLTEWQGGKWKSYLDYVLMRIPVPLPGKTVLDFGCRYGLLSPLLFELGAGDVIGIEDLDLYLGPGEDLFQGQRQKLKFIRSEHGYIPLQPGTVDVAILNEVISHVHPSYLPVVFSELARVLVPGGTLFVSDGNNLGNPRYFHDRLLPLYEALENGPDGARVGDVTVQACFVGQRRRMILTRHPDLPAEKADVLALNTSGLHGEYLTEVIDRFVQKGELVRRPYRKGIPPVYPDSGQVEERGFYPEGVVFDLMQYGFTCSILDRPSRAPAAAGRIPLPPDRMKPASGYGNHAYEIRIPDDCPDQVAPIVLEDERALPIPTDNHAEISEKGMGRYSIWKANGTIYLSAADNSDPRKNGRKYELYWTDPADENVIYPGANFQIVAVSTPVV